METQVPTPNTIQSAAADLTAEQIRTALELSSRSNVNFPADPGWLGAILVALATNTATLNAAAAAGTRLQGR